MLKRPKSHFSDKILITAIVKLASLLSTYLQNSVQNCIEKLMMMSVH